MIGNPLATNIKPSSRVVMTSELIGYRAHNAILLSLIVLNRLNQRARKLSNSWDLITFNPDISTGRRRVVDAMIVDCTARRADVMIGSYTPGSAASTIG